MIKKNISLIIFSNAIFVFVFLILSLEPKVGIGNLETLLEFLPFSYPFIIFFLSFIGEIKKLSFFFLAPILAYAYIISLLFTPLNNLAFEILVVYIALTFVLWILHKILMRFKNKKK